MGPAGPELERNTSDLTACTDNDLRQAADSGGNQSGAESGALSDAQALVKALLDLPPNKLQAVLNAIRTAIPGDAEGDPR